MVMNVAVPLERRRRAAEVDAELACGGLAPWDQQAVTEMRRRDLRRRHGGDLDHIGDC